MALAQADPLFKVFEDLNKTLRDLGYELLTPSTDLDKDSWSLEIRSLRTACNYCKYPEYKCLKLRNNSDMTHCCIQCFSDLGAHD